MNLIIDCKSLMTRLSMIVVLLITLMTLDLHQKMNYKMANAYAGLLIAILNTSVGLRVISMELLSLLTFMVVGCIMIAYWMYL